MTFERNVQRIRLSQLLIVSFIIDVCFLFNSASMTSELQVFSVMLNIVYYWFPLQAFSFVLSSVYILDHSRSLFQSKDIMLFVSLKPCFIHWIGAFLGPFVE